MKYINLFILNIILLANLIFCDDVDDEQKTYDYNGKAYNVNASSLNLTNEIPSLEQLESNLDEASVKKNTTTFINLENKEKKYTGYDILPIIGHMSPLGENLRHAYNPGPSYGLAVNFPKSFNFFNKDWDISASFMTSKFNALSNNYSGDFKITSLISKISSNFGPVNLSFGIGMSNTKHTNQDKSFVTGTFDIGYKIFENNKTDIFLQINIQEILGGPNNSISNSTSEIYGISLEIGNKIFN